eukprot:11164328-Heterocapsa_arctica.AAC.1
MNYVVSYVSRARGGIGFFPPAENQRRLGIRAQRIARVVHFIGRGRASQNCPTDALRSFCERT